MKAGTFAIALAALASAAVGAALVASGGEATGGGQAAAFTVGRAPASAKTKAPSPTTQQAASVPSRDAPAAAAVPPVTPESLGAPEVDAEVNPTAPEAAAAPSFRQTNTYAGGVVYVPVACSGAYDVILHFHGAHNYVRELVEKAQIQAVVVVFNSGNGAERYSQAFQGGGMLNALLRQIELATAPLCPGGEAKPKRVALSAWSAGYAAVEKLLARSEDRSRVDAVLLADGLHAPLMDRWKRTFAPKALEAFVELGTSAIAGGKLFAITHSAIETPGYGSTTECSKLLLEKLSLPSQGNFVSANVSGFSIEGSGGADKAAHIAQFRQMDAGLLSKLRKRWGG